MSVLFWSAGWALIHLTWITTLLGLFAMGMRARSQRAPATRRHAIALASVGTLLIAVPLTFAWTSSANTRESAPLAPATTCEVMAPAIAASLGPTVPDRAPRAWTQPQEPAREAQPTNASALVGLRSAVVWLWMVGALWLCLRLGRSSLAAQRLVRRSVPVADGASLATVQRVAQALGYRGRVRIVATTELDSPGVFGVLRPTVLLPEALLTWPATDLELVLCHELAHIQRQDWIGSGIQRITECLLFFHPFTWWLSRWLRLERECCCDAIVVDHTGRPKAYARALLALSSPPRRPIALLAMSGNPLVDRVAHIFNQESKSMRTSGPLPFFAVAMTLVSVAAVAARAQDPRPSEVRTTAVPKLGSSPAKSVDPAAEPLQVDPRGADALRRDPRLVEPAQTDPLLDHIRQLQAAIGAIDANRNDPRLVEPAQTDPLLDHIRQLQAAVGANGAIRDPHASSSADHRYRVRAGDSLYSIAKRQYGAAADVRRILDANPNLDPDRLAVGQVLQLPLTTRNPTRGHPSRQGTDVHNRVQELEVAVRRLQLQLARMQDAHKLRSKIDPERTASRLKSQPESAPGYRGTVLHVDQQQLVLRFRANSPQEAPPGTKLAIYAGRVYKGEAVVNQSQQGLAICRILTRLDGRVIRPGDRCASNLGTTKSVNR